MLNLNDKMTKCRTAKQFKIYYHAEMLRVKKKHFLVKKNIVLFEKIKNFVKSLGLKHTNWRHDTHPNDTQHNVIQRRGFICDILHK